MNQPDKILEDAAALFKEKHKEYGDNWKEVGPILFLMMKESGGLVQIPNAPWYWDRIHLITMILVKLTRYCNNLKQGIEHKDSVKDLVVYAAMLDSLSDDLNK